jgi:hypothetical protein
MEARFSSSAEARARWIYLALASSWIPVIESAFRGSLNRKEAAERAAILANVEEISRSEISRQERAAMTALRKVIAKKSKSFWTRRGPKMLPAPFTPNQVRFSESVDTIGVAECDDVDERKSAWSTILARSPITHMVMFYLRERFGGDAADPDSWVSVEVEKFPWLVDIYIEVKEWFQSLTAEEERERSAIMFGLALVSARRPLCEILVRPN